MIDPMMLDGLAKQATDGAPEWRDGPSRALVKSLVAEHRAVCDELADLREAVDHHRIELLSSHKRWPNWDGEVVQIVSCDKALWTAAGVEPDAPYEDHPLERLHALTDRFRARIDEARWLLNRCENAAWSTNSDVKERAERWLLTMP